MRSTRLGAVFTVLVILLLLVWRLPDWFAHGNQRVIEAWGDGYKAYHAILYHAQYDSTYSWYGGMNYPYGEHVIPGASQPLLSNTMKWLTQLGWQPLDYGWGLIHGSMLVSLLLCGLFIFLIFRRLNLPVWLSSLSAIALTFMSPQLARFTSHYGLAHPDVLPVVLYLLLRYHERARWTWALALAGVLTVYSAIHFYYFAILSFTVAAFFGVRWLARRDWRFTLRYVVHGALALVLPFALFSTWLFFTDPVTDRTEAPWGFFHFHAYAEGIFTSLDQPHWRWFNDHIVSIRRVGFEGRAYAGLVALGYAIFALVRYIRHRGQRAIVWGSSFLNLLFVAASGLLLFSFGIPFVLPGLEGLIDFAGPIRQFRSIGRFAWVFFYAINLCAIYELYRYVQQGQARARIVFSLALAVLLIESYQQQRHIDLGLETIVETEPGQRFTDLDIDYTRYQAILPIPYYYIGSDNFWWEGSGFSMQKSLTLSLQTGLPVTGAMLTRSSRRQALDQLQLVTEPYRPGQILNDYPDNRPLLVVWDKVRAAEEYRGRFDFLRAGATLLHETGELQLLELPLSAFAQIRKARHDSLLLAYEQAIQQPDDWRVSDSTASFLQMSFDEHRAVHTYQGTGALAVPARELSTVFDQIALPGYAGPLTLSAWFFFDADRHGRTDFYFTEIDPVSGDVLQRQQQAAHRLIQVVDPNGWLYLEWPLERKQANSRLVWEMQNPRLRGETISLDEVLLRPSHLEVYRYTNDTLYWNGRIWPDTD